jgi:hypothetical protein
MTALWRTLVTPSLRCFDIHEALVTITEPAACMVHYPLLGFRRLQGMNRTSSSTGMVDAFLSFFPFSAATNRQDEGASRLQRYPLTGFRNLPAGLHHIWLAGLFHPAGTPRVKVFRASLHIDRLPSPAPCFFAVTCLSWPPSQVWARFPIALATGSYLLRLFPDSCPFPLRGGFHLRPWPTLKLSSRHAAPLSRTGFTRNVRMQLS